MLLYFIKIARSNEKVQHNMNFIIVFPIFFFSRISEFFFSRSNHSNLRHRHRDVSYHKYHYYIIALHMHFMKKKKKMKYHPRPPSLCTYLFYLIMSFSMFIFLLLFFSSSEHASKVWYGRWTCDHACVIFVHKRIIIFRFHYVCLRFVVFFSSFFF